MIEQATELDLDKTLGVDVFQALFDRCSNWGRWGADDEHGTLNLITPDVRVRAAALVRDGVSVTGLRRSQQVGRTGDVLAKQPAQLLPGRVAV